ncbi:MAG: HEAT repeat domain-containing protein, partial [Planctomycetota bacterium]
MRRPFSLLSTAGVGLLFAATLAAQTPPGDRTADLRSKSIETRLLAIDWLATADKKDADTLLLQQLADKDWEIQERAAESLGKRKSKVALKQLVDLAIDGDVVRVRRAAALAAGAVDAVAASADVWKRCKGKEQVLAQEALALVLRGHPGFAEIGELQKRAADPSAPVRESAAAAFLEGAPDRGKALRHVLDSSFVATRCRVLDAVAEAPRVDDLDPLLAAFAGAGQNEVTVRRLCRALAAVLALGDEHGAERVEAALTKAGTTGMAVPRRARLVPMLTVGKQPVITAAQAVPFLEPLFRSTDPSVRAATAKALREVGGDAAVAALRTQSGKESESRVLTQLVEALADLDLARAETVAFLVDVASGRGDELLRERAIVRLGRSGVKDAADALARLTGEPEWRLACCALVSLGKTDDPTALPALVRASQHADWRMRGAAAIGLMHWSHEDAIEPLLALLADREAIVARTAHAALGSISRQYETKPDPRAWRAWWTSAKGKHDFTDREATAAKQKAYGYAAAPTDVYTGLDVVVLQSVGLPDEGGDHIQQLLAELKIAHRTTVPGKILDAVVHPEAIFVSNCWGKVDDADVEPLRWFVVTGGSLFGSCWALTETIARIEPGVVQMAATRDQVMDDVRALPCRQGSGLLTGVFPPSVVPIYHLEGAQLIEVRDHERCEVLIDSPDAAERWGCGNLAAWFRCGHGVLFDSANHFDLQGLAQAGDALKGDKERQAYAVDHMGLSLADWRASRSQGYWKNAQKAAQGVPDLSA